MNIAGYQILDDILDGVNAKISNTVHVFPPEEKRFFALDKTPIKNVKVVILGQDPYHGKGQAHGLSFSVEKGVKLPPSLRNIYKEIEVEFGSEMSASGCLTPWADQGVLLLNAVLSVEEGQPNSHKGIGWEQVTDSIIEQVSEQCEHVVFMLWGAYAQKKEKLIDSSKHLILKSPHPSPFSAHKGFFGNGHFKKANSFLEKHSLKPIFWKI